MKMKYIKDLYKRSLLLNRETKVKKIKSSFYNQKTTSLEDKLVTNLLQKSIPRNSSRTRIRNRCILTNRPRAVSSRFSLARTKLREMFLIGNIYGVTKSSW